MQKPTISSQPPAKVPDRNEPSTFANWANAWVVWIRNAFYPFLKATNDYGELTNAAAAAAQQAVLDNTSHQGEWVPGAFYVIGDTVWSPSTGRVYRRINSVGVGTNDPADAPAYWVDTTIANVQSSPDDDTDGRILTNGAHGLGAGLIEYSGDIDDFALPTGFYRVQAGATGDKPAGFGAFNMVVLRRTDGVSIGNTDQFAIAKGGIWIRSGGPTTWGKWYRGWSARSLLDSVSNDGDGDPSGGLFESGNNANGEYLLMADGRQICTHILAKPGNANLTAWTFPVAFAAIDSMSATPLPTGALDGRQAASISSYSTSAMTVEARNWATGAVDAYNIAVMAIGRWTT